MAQAAFERSTGYARLVRVDLPRVEIEDRRALVLPIHLPHRPARERIGHQPEKAAAARGNRRGRPRRFACIYQPDGVPMPLAEDPAFEDWSWFPHGSGADFRLTKCLEPLAPLRSELTVVSGMSHPAVRAVHGHSNADQFLTGADTGASAAIGAKQNCYSVAFPIPAPAKVVVKARQGSGPVAAQVYSRKK